MKLEITSRDGKYKFYTEKKNILTIEDIKQYLKSNLQIKNKIISVYNNGFLLDESVDLSKFETLCLTFDINNDTIEDIVEEINTNEISTNKIKEIKKVNKQYTKIRINGSKKVMIVKTSQLYFHNGKVMLIKKKNDMFSWTKLFNYVKNIKITRDDIGKLIAFGMLIFTNNSEILMTFSTIFFLQFISRMFITHNRKCSESLDYYSRTAMMFIVSMFMIDHHSF
ncbi:uncharacterized protein VNE69_10113 [Vairimorpha necatrix]|uniref:Membrane protein n=1 Tax=Vairimorpha necatrix TaxID=6039 RepID=A0AAX4JFU7_9MICR